nr:MAG TPA: Protein of unknown function (DUF3716) [Caudoviricetes sp.]
MESKARRKMKACVNCRWNNRAPARSKIWKIKK